MIDQLSTLDIDSHTDDPNDDPVSQDLWTAPGPAAEALLLLERLEQRRAVIESCGGSDDASTRLRSHLLATLDLMEEHLCEVGCDAPFLAKGWETLDALQPRLGGRPDDVTTRPTSIRQLRRATNTTMSPTDVHRVADRRAA